jgi:alpha-N-acetylglucosaminidase
MLSASATSAAKGVLVRLLGNSADTFGLREIPKENGLDVFLLEGSNGRLYVSGSSGGAICRGAYEYLKRACHCLVTWDGDQLSLPKGLPDFPRTRVVWPNKYRHYYNVCTFGYTLVWWDWKMWEREIDWMSLHGINMPLAMTG